MPHATEDEEMGGMAMAEAGMSFLDTAEMNNFSGRALDQSTKADDAVDYEDISDEDDLPEEEEATNGVVHDPEVDRLFANPAPAFDGSATQPVGNGFHGTEEPSGDVSDGFDEVNDLFGDDRNLSPEAERQPPTLGQPQRPYGGLALPSTSGLVLPRYVPGSQRQRQTHLQTSQSASASLEHPDSIMSPASMTSDDSDDSLDADTALQQRLFRESRRRNAGENDDGATFDVDMDEFYSLYPGYEQYQAPKFVELFPPRNGHYKGKAPLKPPKPVLPTKLSLDLLPDQERGFRTVVSSSKNAHEQSQDNGIVYFPRADAADDDSSDDQSTSVFDDEERIGNVTMWDLKLMCKDWDTHSSDAGSANEDYPPGDSSYDDWDFEENRRATKKRKINALTSCIFTSFHDTDDNFDNPERLVMKLSKQVALDLNDPHILIEEHAQRTKRKVAHIPGNTKRDSALSRDLAKRYNISNDQAYDLLKENHQHKIRSTLGSMAVEHSLPASRLQYPFYRIKLDNRAKRAFHRPQLELRTQPGREYRFQKPKHIKKKHWRGREAKDIYAKAEDLSLGDNASTLLLEYSEEAPMMMSNFGMGNRLINYYRKKDANDQERPKRDIGETQVLLTQDKSPFANFGHVNGGEVVPTIQNGLYRAPVFSHEAQPVDFIIGISSTYEDGDRFYLRNVENLHVVGQQFPSAEVPGQHSRKVTDAAKKRLRALAYRIFNKSLVRRDKVLNNASLMPHLPGHDMPQTRSKMREFMRYDRIHSKSETTGVWVPKPNEAVPDEETMRAWIKPEDICMLDAMQVGVQHLADLGITEAEGKEADEDKAMEDGNEANLEQQLAPWRASKNFINATQGKAMLVLHGPGDPTGRGQGFSFVKTSMKGGFVPQGESVADKLDARRRKENGGHSYNVASQQAAYDGAIRQIWANQKQSLSSNVEASDVENEDDPESVIASGRGRTPRSSVAGTPVPLSRYDDELTSQISGQSATRGGQVLVITRTGGRDAFGQEVNKTETVTNPRVIAMYKARVLEKRSKNQSLDHAKPTGDPELDAHLQRKLELELSRVQRNAERRQAREKAKANKHIGDTPSAAGSPGPSDADGPASSTLTANGTPQKGKGRNKDPTQRKCANCGQVGHIKTNRKSVLPPASYTCPFCHARNKIEADGSSSCSPGQRRDSGLTGSHALDTYSAFKY